jgi:hypothetical protein
VISASISIAACGDKADSRGAHPEPLDRAASADEVMSSALANPVAARPAGLDDEGAEILSWEDDCAPIRERLEAQDGPVYLDPAPAALGGVYTCRYPIVLRHDGASLVGRGGAPGPNGLPARVSIKLADWDADHPERARAPLLVVGTITVPDAAGVLARRVRHVTVENLDLDGNRDNQIDPWLVDSKNPRRLVPQALHKHEEQSECWGATNQFDCGSDANPHGYIRNNGVTVRGADDVTIRNVSVQGALSGGITLEKRSGNLVVENLTSRHNLYDGFAAYETTPDSQSVFRHLRFEDNLHAGISIDLNFNGNAFDDFQIVGNHDVGIFARDSADNSFSNFLIEGNKNGVYLGPWDNEGNNCVSGYRFAHGEIAMNIPMAGGDPGIGFIMAHANCPDNSLTDVWIHDNDTPLAVPLGASLRTEAVRIDDGPYAHDTYPPPSHPGVTP